MTATLFMLLGGCIALVVENVWRRRRMEQAWRRNGINITWSRGPLTSIKKADS